jgi:hypothetical protein
LEIALIWVAAVFPNIVFCKGLKSNAEFTRVTYIRKPNGAKTGCSNSYSNNAGPLATTDFALKGSTRGCRQPVSRQNIHFFFAGMTGQSLAATSLPIPGRTDVLTDSNGRTVLSAAGGFQHDGFSAPRAVAIKSAGNVWVANYGGQSNAFSGSVTELVGLAGPVKTPTVEQLTGVTNLSGAKP